MPARRAIAVVVCRPGPTVCDSTALRDELVEAHWSYTDRYATELIARGPTLADDGDTATGSLHIVDLPGPAAARAFAFDEPNYQAGVYRDVLVRAPDRDTARAILTPDRYADIEVHTWQPGGRR